MSAAAEKGSNFYLGFLFLPRRRREALSAVYAFARHVDDIADSGELPAAEARRQLDFWREEIARLYAGRPTHPLSRRLEPFVQEFALPREGFEELVRGVGMDLEKTRYETFEELKPYLFGVAGAVGLLCVEVFGHRHTSPEDLREYAVAMGNAFQLTNIIRDVGADLEKGRIYIPVEDIRAAGGSVEDIARRAYTPAFRTLMNGQYERAKAFYRRARGLLHPKDRPSMLPAEAMACVYEALLDKIKEEQFRVFFQRVRVPSWRKALLAAKAWAASKGIY